MKLSLSPEEVRKFAVAPNGSFDFGYISAEHAMTLKMSPGAVRLQYGIPGGKGFGKRHIEDYSDRMKQLVSLGYLTCEDFVFSVAQNYQKIGEGSECDKLSLIYRAGGYDLQLIIKHNDEGFWSVTTGLPYRVARCKILINVSREDGREPTSKPAEAPRFATLSLPKP